MSSPIPSQARNTAFENLFSDIAIGYDDRSAAENEVQCSIERYTVCNLISYVNRLF